ncbi:MAG TPA: HAD-IIIA family hydrolase [Alphaproteobacteria bacterium]|nr:HAD-IIIA family hydrolase [Alphaproteobacteria bacterium]
MNRLVLLDRDGVLNQDRDDYVKSPEELVMIEGAAEAVARLNRAGHIVALVTNQSAVGRGIIEDVMLERIHQRLRDNLARVGARLDDIFVCPEAPWQASERRKPGPGMLREALARFRAEAALTPLIGDTLGDLQAATAAGCQRLLVRTGKGAATQAAGLPQELLPISVHESLAPAVAAVLGEEY